MRLSRDNQSFNGSYKMYFYTNDGKRIVSDENMKKCLHYVEAHLNNSKRIKNRNMELVDTFRFGQVDKTGKRVGGDVDYFNIPKIRAVYKKAKNNCEGFIRIVTGKDAKFIDETYGKAIGKAKRESLERTGYLKSYETLQVIDNYFQKSIELADKKCDDRIFGVAFTPKYKKNGEIKGFEYYKSGFFKE